MWKQRIIKPQSFHLVDPSLLLWSNSIHRAYLIAIIEKCWTIA